MARRPALVMVSSFTQIEQNVFGAFGRRLLNGLDQEPLALGVEPAGEVKNGDLGIAFGLFLREFEFEAHGMPSPDLGWRDWSCRTDPDRSGT